MAAPKKKDPNNRLICIYVSRSVKERIEKKALSDGFESIAECGRLLFLQYLEDGFKRGMSAEEVFQRKA